MQLKRNSFNYAYNKNKSTPSSALMGFLSRWWFLIVGFVVTLVFIVPMVKRWIDKQKVKDAAADLQNAITTNNTENSTANPNVVAQKVAKIKRKYPNVTDKKIKEISTNAQRMAVALGTNVQDHHLLFGGNVELFNNFSEDEETAVKIAKMHTGTFPILEDLYYSLHTNSRNLKNDLLKYLSKDDLDEIRKAHLKYGNFKHI